MPKILRKSIRGVVILLCCAYLLILLKMKVNLANYIQSQDSQVKVDYSWFWIDWQGDIHFKNLSLLDQDKKPLVVAPWTHVAFASPIGFWKINDWLVYQQFPQKLNITIENAFTTVDWAASQYWADYQSALNALLPAQCVNSFPTIYLANFNAALAFSYNSHNSKLELDTQFSANKFVEFTLQSNLADFFETNFTTAAIESFSFKADNLVWLQQLVLQCMAKNKIDKSAIGDVFRRKLALIAEQNRTFLNTKFTQDLSLFFNAPEMLTLNYTPTVAYDFERLLGLPVSAYGTNLGIELILNGNSSRSFFDTSSFQQQLTDKKNLSLQSFELSKSFLPIHAQGLVSFVGSEVILHFKNAIALKGSIDHVDSKRVFLSQFKFNGRSVLPYQFNDIDSIELVTNQ